MPAACVDACLASPSRLFAILISSFTFWSFSINSFNLGSAFIASSIVMFNVLGTSFATLSTSIYGISKTRPTSLITPLAAIVPKVIIWATWSVPNLFVT